MFRSVVNRCAVAHIAARTYVFLNGNPMTAQSTTPVPIRPMLLIGSAGGLLVAGTVGLWAWYGTSVFFEVLRAGWSACF